MSEEIDAPEYILRLVHFPFAHSEECCRQVAKLFATCGLILFIVLAGLFSGPSDGRGFGIVMGLAVLAIYMAWHLILMVKKLFSPCYCGRRINTLAELWRIVFWTGLVCGQSIFCSWLSALHVLPDYCGRNSASVLFGALSYTLPAFTLIYLARRIRAYGEHLITDD
jgi:hypothetical protein